MTANKLEISLQVFALHRKKNFESAPNIDLKIDKNLNLGKKG